MRTEIVQCNKMIRGRFSDHSLKILGILVFTVSFNLLRLPNKPFYSFIYDSQVCPFHLVIQETIANKLRCQFWYKHILVQHSLDTSVGQSYLCTKPFKV